MRKGAQPWLAQWTRGPAQSSCCPRQTVYNFNAFYLPGGRRKFYCLHSLECGLTPPTVARSSTESGTGSKRSAQRKAIASGNAGLRQAKAGLDWTRCNETATKVHKTKMHRQHQWSNQCPRWQRQHPVQRNSVFYSGVFQNSAWLLV